MSRTLLPCLLALTLPTATAIAAQSDPAPPPSASRPDPERDAAKAYNDGLERLERAQRMAEKAGAESDPGRRAALEEKARGQYRAAIERFEHATASNPHLHAAFSSLGYAYRRSGRLEESLAAYERALTLEPGYAPAIEYRAEAHLGLNRLAEVRAAYDQLLVADRTRADELLQAARLWLDQRNRDPGGVEPTARAGFAAWVDERLQAAAAAAPAAAPQPEKGW